MNTIGANIRLIRKTKGLTQRELGELIGINEANIRKYESGRQIPRPETLQKIADALEVKTYNLTDRNADVTTKDCVNARVFSRNLRAARDKSGLSQTELAKMINKRPYTVSALENGEVAPRIETVKKCAEVLGVSPLELVGVYREDLQAKNEVKRWLPFSLRDTVEDLLYEEENKEMSLAYQIYMLCGFKNGGFFIFNNEQYLVIEKDGELYQINSNGVHYLLSFINKASLAEIEPEIKQEYERLKKMDINKELFENEKEME